jgi:hypothetical protein
LAAQKDFVPLPKILIAIAMEMIIDVLDDGAVRLLKEMEQKRLIR